MAYIRKTLSRVEREGKSEIFLRVVVSHTIRPRLKSCIYVDGRFFRNGEICPNSYRYRFSEAEREEARAAYAQLHDLCDQILDIVCRAKSPEEISKDYLFERISWTKIAPQLSPMRKTKEKKEPSTDTVSLQEKNLYDFFEDYVLKKVNNPTRLPDYVALKRRMMRYECFERMMGNTGFSLTLDNLNFDVFDRFQRYLSNEGDIARSHPKQFDWIMEQVEMALPHARQIHAYPDNLSKKSVIDYLKCIRSVCNWLCRRGYLKDDPFAGVQISETHYTSRPVFISVEERKALAALDLTDDMKLEQQRDIFIFQCLVGCRYGDLVKLTKDNIIGGEILQYSPGKTKRNVNPVIPRVPLAQEAKKLIEKYRGVDEQGRLFPFLNINDYNSAIRRFFTRAGLTRKVIVVNPHTDEPELVALNEIASSHMARRTFVGNLYNKLKDPAIISVMSGHSSSSKSFFRYRDIGDDVREEVISKM